MMTPKEDWYLQFRLIHGLELAERMARPTATGKVFRVPPKPEALRWLIAEAWLECDDEEVVRAACGVFHEREPEPPSIRGLM
jgi:hypothetical protein